MTEEQHALELSFRRTLQHETDEVARLHDSLARQAEAHRRILAHLARHEDLRIEACCKSHIHLRHEGVFEAFLRHRAQDTRRADDGNAADDAKDRIQRAFCKFLTCGNRNRDVRTAVLAEDFLDDVANQLARPRIDRRLARRHGKPWLRDRADAAPRMEMNAAPLRANDDFRKDGNAIRDVWIIS